jgi:hypothetical protein
VTEDALDYLAITRLHATGRPLAGRGSPADGTMDVFPIPRDAP